MLAESWRRFRRSRSGVFGLAVVAALVLIALLAPWLTPYDPLENDYAAVMQPPSRAHPLGTDNFGRDVLARTLYGARLSLRAGVTSVAVALALGLPIGLVSGYFRGFWDEYVIMRVVDALQAFPFLILALAVTAALGQGLNQAMIAIGIGFTPGFIRIVRSAVLEVRSREFVQAARSLGAGDGRILLRHVLPNALGPIIVQTTLSVAAAIIAEAGLSYLGLGAQPPEPSWGSDLRAAQGFLTLAPWMAIWPGLAIFLSVLGFNMLGDGLRDALDPRLRGD
ncbi:MAG: ABC transporter permease [Firmicutes bacterium]|nr:ABC transporter permease [Bacillota bacterium]